MVMALSPPGSGNSDVKVIVSSDISGLKPGMQDAKEEIKDLGAQVETTAGKLNLMEQASNLLKGSVSSLSGGFGELVSIAMSAAPAIGVVSVAALGAFAVAAKKGIEETEKLSRELVMSGNAAGTTVGQLQELAGGVATSANSVRGDVVTAMTAIVSAGGVAAEQISKVSEAAVLLEKFGGQAVAKTASEFADLGESPVDASIKLNQHYNYLTASIFEQIKALEDQGQATEAARVAQEAYADAVIPRMQELAAQAGTLEKSWLAIKTAARSAWDSMMDIGRGDEVEGKLAKARATLDGKGYFTGGLAFGGDAEARSIIAIAEASRNAAKAAGERTAAEAAGIKWAEEGDQYLSKADQKKRALIKLENDYLTLAKAKTGSQQDELKLLDQYQQRVSAINEKYAEKSTAKRATTADPNQSAVDRLRLEGRAADAGIAPQTMKELDALDAVQKKSNLSMTEYLRLAGVAMANDPLIAANKRAVALELKAEAEATQYLGELQGKFDRSNQAKLDSMQTLPESTSRLNGELRKVAEQATDAGNRLARMYGDGKLSAEAYNDDLEKLNSLIADQKAAVTDLNSQQDRLNSSWEVGADRAMTKYAESSKNVAASSEQAFTKAFSNMEDALTQFAMTGKITFSSFANAIISDLIRVQIRAAMTQAISGASGLFSGFFGGSSSGSYSSSSSASTTAGYSSGDLGSGITLSAYGNVFSESPSLHQYVNTVQDSPKVFAFNRMHAFASGGVFAEAGPEAVMPLTRDSSGRLGVQAAGSGNSTPSVAVEIVNNGTAQQVDSAQAQFDALKGWVVQIFTSDIDSEGPMAKKVQNQYGINRSAGAYA